MPRRPSNVIHISKPPKSAFNKNRRASRLLLDQMIHVSRALIEHLKRHDNRESKEPITEARAGELVRCATAILHPHIGPQRSRGKSKTSGAKKGRRERA